jgi:hypothetical protein
MRAQALARCAGAAVKDTILIVPKVAFGTGDALLATKSSEGQRTQQWQLQEMGVAGVAIEGSFQLVRGLLLALVGLSTAGIASAAGAVLLCRGAVAAPYSWPVVGALAAAACLAHPLWAPAAVLAGVTALHTAGRHPALQRPLKKIADGTSTTLIGWLQPVGGAVAVTCEAAEHLRRHIIGAAA